MTPFYNGGKALPKEIKLVLSKTNTISTLVSHSLLFKCFL